MATVSISGLNLIRGFERLFLTAYRLPGERYWTYGWGHSGPEVRPMERITSSFADALFQKDIQQRAIAVENMLLKPINQGPFDALVSLAYNIGVGRLRDSELMAKLNAGDTKGAILQFCEWNRDSTGQISLGLIRRRAAEVYLFMADVEDKVRAEEGVYGGEYPDYQPSQE